MNYKGNEIKQKYLLLAESEASMYDELKNYKYTSVFTDLLEYVPNEYYKCWSGSERAVLLYRVQEMRHYYNEHEGVKELIDRLVKITEKEEKVII